MQNSSLFIIGPATAQAPAMPVADKTPASSAAQPSSSISLRLGVLQPLPVQPAEDAEAERQTRASRRSELFEFYRSNGNASAYQIVYLL